MHRSIAKQFGNPGNQSGRRKGSLWWEGFAEKVSFKPGVKEWRGNGWWKWWVDGTDGGSATQRTGWCRIGEISAWLTERSRELILETRGSIWEGTICYSSRRWCGWMRECDQRFPGLFTDTSEHIRFFSLLFLFSTVSFPRCRLILLMKVFYLIRIGFFSWMLL